MTALGLTLVGLAPGILVAVVYWCSRSMTKHPPPSPELEALRLRETIEAIVGLTKGGGNPGQWAAIVALAATLAVHIISDGTIKIASRAIAEDQGRKSDLHPQL